MTRLFAFLALATLSLHGSTAAEPIPAPPETDELQSIFNGEDLSGWSGDPRLWSVHDGVIHGETTKENAANGNTFLIWQEGTLKDFELRLAFRVSSVNNSGIQYRSRHITEGKPRNDWVVRGYQHEIRNSDQMPSVAGFIYDEGGSRGRMCLVGEKAVWDADGKTVTDTLITPEEYAELFRVDDWNKVVIRGKGNRLQHYMNGRLILDCIDGHPEKSLAEGVLALQLHAGAPMWVEYKEIRLKELK